MIRPPLCAMRAKTPSARTGVALVFTPGCISRMRTKPSANGSGSVASSSLNATVPPLKSTTTRTKPGWSAMRICVAVSGAAEAACGSTRQTTTAATTPAQKRMPATIRPQPGDRQPMIGCRSAPKSAASAHSACRICLTWVAFATGGRDGRPEGEHERDGPGLAEVRSQSPHAERTAGRTPPLPIGSDEHGSTATHGGAEDQACDRPDRRCLRPDRHRTAVHRSSPRALLRLRRPGPAARGTHRRGRPA